MRCKQGDLAVIVRSTDGHEGKIVKCLKFYHGGARKSDGTAPIGDYWFVEPQLIRAADGKRIEVWPDQYLRPIRDPGPDAVDETLQRLGTPADKAMRDLDEALAELKRVSRELKELEKELAR